MAKEEARADRGPLDARGSRPRLLVLSHVPPLPRDSGQRQRVFHTLTALRAHFHVTLACLGGEARFETLCDELVVVPSKVQASWPARLLHGIVGACYRLATGLRQSNYALNRVEFTPRRLETLLGERRFDLVLVEYTHATRAVAWFQARGMRCVLDMHDVLWRSHARRLAACPWLPGFVARWALARYRRWEEAAWGRFDGVIAITPGEHEDVRSSVPESTTTFVVPMGVDLGAWAFREKPAASPRLAFYGGLSSAPNVEGAMRCAREILPQVRERVPDVELWLVGASPAPAVGALASEVVHVTGFVEDVASLLGEMHAVLCPWRGTFGFRSRLIEVMALGVPVVVTADAIHGMGLAEGEGVLVGETDGDLAECAVRLLEDSDFRLQQGRLARSQVERGLGLEATYGRLAGALVRWVRDGSAGARSVRPRA